MMDSQFASLDGTVGYDTETLYYTPNSSNMARRSVSIFSRRGSETPEPQPPFIAQAAIHTLKNMTEKQKSWIGRRKSLGGVSSQKANALQKPKGTVLNAVPPAKLIQMTALEEEMAHGPNEEIVSAVSELSPRQYAWTPQPDQISPIEQTSSSRRNGNPLLHRSKSVKKRETHSRIGLWVNGVTQWDEEVRQYRAAVEERGIRQETGFTVVQLANVDEPNALCERPPLSVMIPGSETKIKNPTSSPLASPRLRRCVVSVAPASIVSKYNITPAITIEDVTDVAPLAHASPVLVHDRTAQSLGFEKAESRDRPSTSRSSSYYSSVADNDTASMSSKRSSATSVEVIAAPALTKRSSKRLSRKSVSPALPPVEKPTVETSRSTIQLDILDSEFMRSSPYVLNGSKPTSSTLSEAANESYVRLSNPAEDQAVLPDAAAKYNEQVEVDRSGSMSRTGSVRSVMQPPERAPTLPRRSRKREWRASAASTQDLQVAMPQTLVRRRSDIDSGRKMPAEMADGHRSFLSSSVRRSLTVAQAQAMHAHDFAQLLPIPDEKIVVTSVLGKPVALPMITIDDGLIVVRGPVILGEDGEEEVLVTQVAAASAEDVLLTILSTLTSLDDLSSTARVNKGMYRVYKENEIHLIRTVAFNQSPAAWEFREWSPPERNDTESSKASSQLEHTPKSYVRCCTRDVAVIESLKTLILQQCQTFIRHDTALALSSPSHPHAQRFNDAFWRIWCFCKIFGCGKNREDDLTGQLDWLKGGLLANNQGCVATVNTNLDFDMTSVLLNAPEFFAKGNVDGLTAQQLYDMTEIWTCLVTVLRGYQCRVDQAREAGVFNDCDVIEGDVEREEQMLEEWTYHLLTLGPAAVLEIAEHASDSSSAGFTLAKMNGWTEWTPPQYGGSRSTFLKEPVARLYEERVVAAAHILQNPLEQEKKDMSRKRAATLAAEIRLRRQTSSYKRSPYIDMTMERPMSVMQRQHSTTSKRSSHHFDSPVSSRSATPNYTSPEPMSPTLWSTRKISPIIENRVETFNRMSLQNFASGVAEETGERAVRKIVDMGFTATQARDALKMTDMGDGLRVDRAVDLLLRR
ncbi:hypothetical protein LTR08_009297 [Meristemomyces frigidus]|nr:hypothetical protein LTR08_009297 [Meristemomyces frigidus]